MLCFDFEPTSIQYEPSFQQFFFVFKQTKSISLPFCVFFLSRTNLYKSVASIVSVASFYTLVLNLCNGAFTSSAVITVLSARVNNAGVCFNPAEVPGGWGLLI